jgi:hypothetical protein
LKKTDLSLQPLRGQFFESVDLWVRKYLKKYLDSSWGVINFALPFERGKTIHKRSFEIFF